MNKCRIVIIGCGAITQEWHLPILAGDSEFEVVALVDRNEDMLAELSAKYQIAKTYHDYNDVPLSSIDAAVVATPVSLHYQISEFFLKNHKHVLVEKPIALNYSQSKSLVEIADANKCVLSVGLYRRLYPSVTVLKQLIETRELGSLNSVEFNWGAVYSWSATSLGNMKKELAGGGVLMDLGPHALDWLTELLGPELTLIEYTDDALGGIDADCSLRMQIQIDEKLLPVTLNLSRLRNIGGELLLHFTDGTAELSVGSRFDVDIVKTNTTANLSYKARQQMSREPEWFETFKAEFDDFKQAIFNNATPILSGHSVLPAMKIIDECYAQQTPCIQPWVDVAEQFDNLDLAGKSVLITGASGFIGCRLAEVLKLKYLCKIKAAVNNPNNASRLSRLDVELVQLDITDEYSVSKAMEGCDIVVHCAVGTAYGDDALVEKVTVGGTRNLLNAALAQKIERFIHISSLAVTDIEQAGDLIDETVAYTESKDLYPRTKREAEKLVKEFAAKGLASIILRPTNVYGPYSPLFRVGAGFQLMENGLSISEAAANSPINAVYIDNLVAAILCAIGVNKSLANGQHYFVNDDDETTYKDFYQDFASLSNHSLIIKEHNKDKLCSDSSPKPTSEFKQLLKSSQFKQLLKLVHDLPKIGYLPRKLLSIAPSIENAFRDTSPVIYESDTGGSEPIYIEATTRQLVSATKIKNELGFKPVLSSDKARAITKVWLKFTGGDKNL